MKLPIESAERASNNSRIDAIDVLRGLALFGVLAVNVVTAFRVSLFELFLPKQITPSTSEQIAGAFVSIGLEFKAICIFSLLFGVGLAMQFQQLNQRGSSYYWLSRRLFVLLIFGLLHLIFIWNGDILTEYALVGVCALPLLGLPTAALVIIIVLLLATYAAALLPVPLPDQATLQAHVAAANHIYSSAGWLEIWRFSVHEIALILPLHLSILPRTLALFLLGALVWRLHLIERLLDRQRNIITITCITLLLGAVMTCVSFGFISLKPGITTLLISQLSPLVLAIGYCLAFFAGWYNSYIQQALSWFAPVGRMAFTNYILQSVICCLTFFGYGFGLFGRLNIRLALVFVIILYLFQVLGSVVWLRHFQYGPLEWLWRALMYGRMPRMLKANDISSAKS